MKGMGNRPEGPRAPCTHCSCSSRSRRTFLGLLGGAIVASVAWPRLAWAKTVALPFSMAPQLEKVGGSVVLEIKGQKIFLIRDSESTVRATQPLCTHKQFMLEYDSDHRRIACPKHGSRFSLAGKVLKGPAKKPLRVYPTKLDLPNKRVLLKL